MKKIFMTPDIRIVRFDSKDVIVTSGEVGVDAGQSSTTPGSRVQERQSIWD